MRAESCLIFPPFRLDLASERLWRGTQPIALRPKTFAVLRYLIEHAGQLLTKATLLDAVWPDIAVSEMVLMVCIREIRRALGDDPKCPQFIETVHRRGYRFIGPVTAAAALGPPHQHASQRDTPWSTSTPAGSGRAGPGPVVGRDVELGVLGGCFETAVRGTRQVLFVTGEAGIGKTTIVETFLAFAERTEACWVGRGQCIESYGAGEAYMPVLEALEYLGRGPYGQECAALLAHYAPTWLAQLPGLLGAADCEHLHRVALGATPRRMLREIATALEVFTAARPLVLLLEDLHWSDHATLDVLSLVARRQGPARLLLLGTFRPEEVRERGHPVQALVQELQMHRHCEELPLPLLAEAAVATYLTARRQMIPPPERLTRFIHRRTDGNPLFMVTIMDYMLSHSRVGAAQEQEAWSARDEEALGIPRSLQHMLTQQFEQLGPEERQVLAAGSVVGHAFAAAAVAAGLQTDVEQVESWCARLTQRGRWLQSRGPCLWPDQTLSEGYAFSHTLYHEVVYNHLPITRRARLHRWVGERLETAYRGRVDEIAAELAVHFDRGQDYGRAVQYRQQAAENAMRCCAYHEAIHHLRRGLELLQMLPDSATRCAHELALSLGLGMSLSATKGYAHPDVEHLYMRARELGRHLGEPPRLIPALFGLWRSAMQRANYRAAHALGEQCLTLAQRTHDPVRLLKAHAVLGVTEFYLGDLVQAWAHFAQGNALYDPQQHRVLRTFLHPAVACLAWEAFVLCMLGYLDRAVTRVHEARTLAQEFSHLYSLAHTLSMVAAVSQLRREAPATHAWVDASSALASEHEFAQIVAHVTILRGWTMVVQGQARTGIQHMCRGIEHGGPRAPPCPNRTGWSCWLRRMGRWDRRPRA